MEELKEVLDRYNQSLEELMDARKYAVEAGACTTSEDRNMFLTLAKQELVHSELLIQSAERVVEKEEENAKVAWKALRTNLMEWRESLSQKINFIERQK